MTGPKYADGTWREWYVVLGAAAVAGMSIDALVGRGDPFAAYSTLRLWGGGVLVYSPGLFVASLPLIAYYVQAVWNVEGDSEQ